MTRDGAGTRWSQVSSSPEELSFQCSQGRDERWGVGESATVGSCVVSGHTAVGGDSSREGRVTSRGWCVPGPGGSGRVGDRGRDRERRDCGGPTWDRNPQDRFVTGTRVRKHTDGEVRCEVGAHDVSMGGNRQQTEGGCGLGGPFLSTQVTTQPSVTTPGHSWESVPTYTYLHCKYLHQNPAPLCLGMWTGAVGTSRHGAHLVLWSGPTYLTSRQRPWSLQGRGSCVSSVPGFWGTTQDSWKRTGG